MSVAAEDVAKDLIEALKALRACRIMLDLARNKPNAVLQMIAEADRILAKYPNLK